MTPAKFDQIEQRGVRYLAWEEWHAQGGTRGLLILIPVYNDIDTDDAT